MDTRPTVPVHFSPPRTGRSLLFAIAAATIVLALLVGAPRALAQSDPVRVSGSLDLSSDIYTSSSADPNWQPRSEDNVSRAVLRTTLTLFDQIELPFEAYISTQSRGYRQPFNQFGVSPVINKWLRLHAGYYSAQISELTFGDSRLLGGGVELQPGMFRFSALYGISRAAVQPNPGEGFPGEYRRTVIASRIGVGDPSSAYVLLNAVQAHDDTASITLPAPTDSTDAPPVAKENIAASISFGLPITDKARVQGEIALAHTINDVRLRSRDGYAPQIDGAVKASVQLTPAPDWGVNLNTRWVGPGYYTLGYVQLPNDLFEVTVAPSLRLMENRLNLRASLGMMWNNLRNNRLATTQRVIGSLNVNWMADESFGVDGSYSNYGMRSTHVSDSFKVDFINQSVFLSPHYAFEWLGGTNSLAATLAFQDANDGNPLAAAGARNSTKAASALHSITLPSTLLFSTGLFYTALSSTGYTSDILNASETVGHQFFENALNVSVTIGYNIVTVPAGTDGQVSGRLAAAYSFERYGTLSASIMNNRYSYAPAYDKPSFAEWYGSIQYTIGF